jgi:hypothetical protein
MFTVDKPIEPSSNFILATLLTGVYDVNRNETLEEDDFEKVKEWYDSILKLKIKGIIFHNTFSDKTVEKYQNDFVSFVRVEYDTRFSPNVFRYLIYQEFLQRYSSNISNLFVTDISDVVVLQNPFIQPLFLENPSFIFCGDEEKILENEWMMEHSSHLRKSISGFKEYEELNSQRKLLNCGIIGGNILMMKSLIESLAEIHRKYTISNDTPFTLDMGAFNYIIHTKFSDKVIHGRPVNTEFKKYETECGDCWFRHK